MTKATSRADFLKQTPHARAWAALEEATEQQQAATGAAITLKEGDYAGKTAVILGAGVAGLTTAYELLAQRSE